MSGAGKNKSFLSLLLIRFNSSFLILGPIQYILGPQGRHQRKYK